MASQSELKTLEFPRNFEIGHMRGQTIRRDMEELTGATIKVVPPLTFRRMEGGIVFRVNYRDSTGVTVTERRLPSMDLPRQNMYPICWIIQTSGTPDTIELAEELIMALFKYENPKEFSDGLKKIVVISKLHQLLTPNSVLATKVLSLLAACQ